MQNRLRADLTATRIRIRANPGLGAQTMHECVAAARSAACDMVFLQTMFAQAQATAEDLHRAAIAHEGAHLEPRVRTRIERGAAMSAADYVDLLQLRRDWIGRIGQRLQGFNAVLSPTVPIVTPTIASVAPGAERDQAFFRVNGLLLRNTGLVNVLDGCALSLPCQQDDDLPVGLMVWHGALHDDTVLNVGQQIERVPEARATPGRSQGAQARSAQHARLAQ